MKTKLLYILLFIATASFSQRTYMPDDVFEQHMIRMGYDDVLDDYVTTSAIVNIKTLSLGGGIVDPTGIEDFDAIESLNFSNNDIQSINLSENSSLKYLYISGNKLQTLDVGLLTNLETLEAANNELSTINIAQNNELTILNLSGNKLQQIDTKFNGKLERLSLINNLFTTIDVSSNTKLIRFTARDNNALTSLNISNLNYNTLSLEVRNNPNLYCITVSDVEKSFEEFSLFTIKDNQAGFSLDCTATTTIPDANFEQAIIDLGYDRGPINGKIFTGNVSSLSSLILSNKEISDLTGIEAFVNLELLSVRNNNLTNIDLSSNTKLTNITLDNNQLTTFNANSNLNLVYLSCNDNLLTSIDIKQNTLLDSFWGNNNKLVDLDFSKNPNLRILEAKNNLLTNLNITASEKIERVDIAENKLTILNLFSNKKLERLHADDNAITSLDVRLNTDLTRLTIKNNKLHSLSAKNGFNSNMYTFETTGNSNLFCIEVDNIAFSNDNWTKDAQSSYSLDCAPANDDCKNAIPLVFNQETPGDIISGNSNNNPTCVTGTVLADVWYSFIVPQTGEFSIEGTGFGGQLKFAVYENCTTTDATACGDAISLTNLTSGNTLYLKVWLESSSGKSAIKSENGTFTIKAKETRVLSIDDFVEHNNEVMIFPNPASQFVKIKFVKNQIINTVEVFNVLGKRVLLKQANNQLETSLNTSQLSTGIYVVKVHSDNKTLSKKLIIK